MRAAARLAAMAAIASYRAAGTRQEELAAVLASQELLKANPACNSAASGSPDDLKKCVESLQKYVSEVKSQSTRSQKANERYASNVQLADELLRRLESERESHNGRFKELGEQLRAASASELDHDDSGAASLDSEEDKQSHRVPVEAASLASLEQTSEERGSSEGSRVDVSARGRLANGHRHRGLSAVQGGRARVSRHSSSRLQAEASRVAKEASDLLGPFSTDVKMDEEGHEEESLDSSLDGSEGDLVEGINKHGRGHNHSAMVSPVSPRSKKEARLVEQMADEAKRAAITAHNLASVEDGGAGTEEATLAELHARQKESKDLDHMFEEQRKVTARAKEESERLRRESELQQEELRKLEEQEAEKEQAYHQELRRLQELQRRARAAERAREAAHVAEQREARIVSDKESERREATNQLENLQDDLVKLRENQLLGPSATPAPPAEAQSTGFFGGLFGS